MWLFTEHGFFSAVCARQGKPHTACEHALHDVWSVMKGLQK
jgi:hypothetical protein